MTAPEPHAPPSTRRAARLQRARALERAFGAPRDTADPRRSAFARAAIDRPATPVRVGAAARPAAPVSRNEAKTAKLMNPSDPQPRHARRRSPLRSGVVAGLTVVASLVLGSTATVTAAVTGDQIVAAPVASAAPAMIVGRVVPKIAPTPEAPTALPLPAPAQAIPTPLVAAAPVVVEPCALHAFADALAVRDDTAAVAAIGGAEDFRRAVAGGLAPCVDLADPARLWTVINKTRPLTPLDYRPSALAMPQGVRSVEGGSLRADAAAALSAMVAAAAAVGVGEIALESGFRSHTTQETSYGNQVSAQGVELADLSSARPGFSEHQSGLAADVVACADGCGTLDDLAASAQGQWITAHSWEFGWITRYEDGSTPITGYSPEPWHLRYIGPELAKAYHDGGWHTLEQFLGLPPAPGYLG
ncbi:MULTISPECIES: D-alanyl-D-alanine carboxypeptidase family protein [unclassified Microbacterium]|uniref:D-alanyl-D-alanine carboxypeptidase family protein n=1 Tax=unclassified Microbacterium TaxID=2609290 RepID=UPI00214C68F5|nr:MULTISPECIES: D-alanyl-D-alanine carboxypeptidase family protein [unclassified Microbacterium]MCR2808189.1 D-alanyl-D-alanine carboxypeptidase family protein [Microbacterium sp. zg.B185]WIM19349.1 D-alanyl-D-alanine carboxypeptidase family protein [Microbacterium sp. zg-B185]